MAALRSLGAGVAAAHRVAAGGARRTSGAPAAPERGPGRSPIAAPALAAPCGYAAPRPASTAPAVERGAQRARHAPRGRPRRAIARTTRRAARPRRRRRATVSGSIPPIANHGTRRRARPRGGRVEADRRPALLRRRRVDGPDRDVVGAARPRRRRPGRSSASTGRRSRRRRRSRAPRRPACRPGRRGRRRRRRRAARSGRSLRMNSAPCGVAARRGPPRPRRAISSSSRGLVAQLHEVGAAAQRAVERAVEARAVGDEVQVRARRRARRSAPLRHAHSLASAPGRIGATIGASEREPVRRAERAAPRPPTVRS